MCFVEFARSPDFVTDFVLVMIRNGAVGVVLVAAHILVYLFPSSLTYLALVPARRAKISRWHDAGILLSFFFRFDVDCVASILFSSFVIVWLLMCQESKFADWQRVRMQETSKEIPAGLLPRLLDVILRHEIVEQARAGDTVILTGTIIGPAVGNEGVRGLRALGVRDLSYRLAFIANSVEICDGRRDAYIRNRKKDSNDDDMQFTVSSAFSLSMCIIVAVIYYHLV
ncbi:hypothetical protein AHAS_Ahas07G0105700 [Arachis hypogaea]